MSYTDWRVYQEAIVEVFRRLGCNALIDGDATNLLI